MTVALKACQVLSIAERMEQNAARFYRRAAGRCDDPRLCKLFAELAQWEKGHAQAFARMKDRQVAAYRGLGDLELEMEMASASRAEPPLKPVFDACDDPAEELPADATKADVLRMAIRKEEDSILYYTGLREFVLGHGDAQVIRTIIEEEKRHVRILTQSLEQL